jgi:hypothetical protein
LHWKRQAFQPSSTNTSMLSLNPTSLQVTNILTPYGTLAVMALWLLSWHTKTHDTHNMLKFSVHKNTQTLFPWRVHIDDVSDQYGHFTTHKCLSPCQLCPTLVPMNQYNFVSPSAFHFTMHGVSSWYGVRYHPGEQIQKYITLDACIWKLCYFLTTTLVTSCSTLNKSLIHCWKRATGHTLIWSLLHWCSLRQHWQSGDCWIRKVTHSF